MAKVLSQLTELNSHQVKKDAIKYLLKVEQLEICKSKKTPRNTKLRKKLKKRKKQEENNKCPKSPYKTQKISNNRKMALQMFKWKIPPPMMNCKTLNKWKAVFCRVQKTSITSCLQRNKALLQEMVLGHSLTAEVEASLVKEIIKL
jgi:hypothetical protein